MKRIKLIIVVLFIFSLCRLSFASQIIPLKPLDSDDKILIFAPHPDDEALSCAGIIQEALRKKAQVKIVYLTNGDHNQLAFIVYERRLVFRKGEFIHMGEVRRKEAIAAMAYVGLSSDNLIFLGYPDFGTFAMFTRYWQSPKPYKSLLTRLNKVPYQENFSYGKSFIPENAITDLETILESYCPTKIFVSHPADTNGDHRALTLFLDIALWDMEGKIPLPKVYHYLIHHVDWPMPRKYHPELSLAVPDDLLDIGQWFSFDMKPHMVAKKYNALRSYRSQTESSGFYLFSFAKTNELFQRLPSFTTNGAGPNKADTCAEYQIKDAFLNVIVSHPVENHDISKMTFYVFGWRKDVPFSAMPKIFLDIHSNTINVWDGRMRLSNSEGVTVESTGQTITVKISLELLHNPDKALISTRIFSKKVPYVKSIWSKFEFK